MIINDPLHQEVSVKKTCVCLVIAILWGGVHLFPFLPNETHCDDERDLGSLSINYLNIVRFTIKRKVTELEN